VGVWQLLQDEPKLANAAPANVARGRKQGKTWFDGHGGPNDLTCCRLSKNIVPSIVIFSFG
jgi:hypothetical protein